MKNAPLLTTVAFAAAIMLPALADPLPRAEFGQPLEPRGKVLNGVGQSDLIEYASLAGPLGPDLVPAFTMTYLGVKSSPEKIDRRFDNWQSWFDQLPADVGLNLGLSFTQDGKGKEAQYAEAILEGKYDDNLTEIARRINQLNRPVWVRIGYECNGFWNGYEPESYREAFRYITKILREHGGDQVATAWCVHPINGMDRLMEFYPGDEWVDWWSIDLFQPKFLEKPVVREFCKAANEHRRPVLIGESSPSEVPRADQWDKWFVPVFELIDSEPAIKAFSYINRNWNSSRWDWGDCRIQVSPELLEKYKKAVSEPLYAHATAPPPAKLVVEPVKISSDSEEDGRFVIQAEAPLPISLPAVGNPRLAILTLAYELRSSSGEEVDEAEVQLEVRNADSGEVLASQSCRMRERPQKIDLRLPNGSLEHPMELALAGAFELLIDGPETAGGMPPQVTLATGIAPGEDSAE